MTSLFIEFKTIHRLSSEKAIPVLAYVQYQIKFDHCFLYIPKKKRVNWNQLKTMKICSLHSRGIGSAPLCQPCSCKHSLSEHRDPNDINFTASFGSDGLKSCAAVIF